MDLISEEIEADAGYWLRVETKENKKATVLVLSYDQKGEEELGEFYLLYVLDDRIIIGEPGIDQPIVVFPVLKSFLWRKSATLSDQTRPTDVKSLISFMKAVWMQNRSLLSVPEALNLGSLYNFVKTNTFIGLQPLVPEHTQEDELIDQGAVPLESTSSTASPPSTPPRSSSSSSSSNLPPQSLESGILGTPGHVWAPLEDILKQFDKLRDLTSKGFEKRTGGVATTTGILFQMNATLLLLLRLVNHKHNKLRFMVPEFISDALTVVYDQDKHTIEAVEIKCSYAAALMLKAGHQLGRAAQWLNSRANAFRNPKYRLKTVIITPKTLTSTQRNSAKSRIEASYKCSHPNARADDAIDVEFLTEDELMAQTKKEIEDLADRIAHATSELMDFKSALQDNTRRASAINMIFCRMRSEILVKVSEIGKGSHSVSSRAFTPVSVMKRIQELDAILVNNPFFYHYEPIGDKWWKDEVEKIKQQKNNMIQQLESELEQARSRASEAEEEARRAQAEAQERISSMEAEAQERISSVEAEAQERISSVEAEAQTRTSIADARLHDAEHSLLEVQEENERLRSHQQSASSSTTSATPPAQPKQSSTRVTRSSGRGKESM